MKHTKVLILSALIVISLLCGCNYTNDNYYHDTKDYSEMILTRYYSGRQRITKDIINIEKPEVFMAALEGNCESSIDSVCKIDADYPRSNRMSSIKGVIGNPVLLSGCDKLKDSELTLYYKESELFDIPESNIIVLYYDNKADSFQKSENISLDTDKNKVTIKTVKNGHYMLADMYEYGISMGYDVNKYSYKKYEDKKLTSWEKDSVTGDILSIADKRWAAENAPDFHVKNASQLASVVYYANGLVNESLSKGGNITISIEADLDLRKLQWVPMGTSDGKFIVVSINGNGHTIKGLKIDYGSADTGLIGYATGVEISNLTVKNALVRGYGCTGMLCGECHGPMYFKNVSVSGRVDGSDNNTGSFIGSGSDGVYENCNTDVYVNGEKSEYFCYYDSNNAKYADETIFTLTKEENGDIRRTETAEEYKSLTWVIMDSKGNYVLRRNAVNETVLSADLIRSLTKDSYSVHLRSFINGSYVVVSNTIECFQ